MAAKKVNFAPSCTAGHPEAPSHLLALLLAGFHKPRVAARTPVRVGLRRVGLCHWSAPLGQEPGKTTPPLSHAPRLLQLLPWAPLECCLAADALGSAH